jgi:hypothetical protein
MQSNCLPFFGCFLSFFPINILFIFPFWLIFFKKMLLLLSLGYTVTFIKVLKTYHSWIHPLCHFPLSLKIKFLQVLVILECENFCGGEWRNVWHHSTYYRGKAIRPIKKQIPRAIDSTVKWKQLCENQNHQ